MSEYNANDHLHNVTESVQRLTWQAQGVQDITGANIADYEDIAPDADDSVTLVNARTGLPFRMLINNLPPVQDGEGDPSPENVRELIPYTSSKITIGEDVYEIDLPDDFYGSAVDYVNRKIVSDIVRFRVPYTGAWSAVQGTPGVFYRNTGLPAYDKASATRYATGENAIVKWGSSTTPQDGEFTFYTTSVRLYFRPAEELEITTSDALNAWLEENPIYIYVRLESPEETTIPTTIPYVESSDAVLTCQEGTLTVKYQGITPDEP